MNVPVVKLHRDSPTSSDGANVTTSGRRHVVALYAPQSGIARGLTTPKNTATIQGFELPEVIYNVVDTEKTNTEGTIQCNAELMVDTALRSINSRTLEAASDRSFSRDILVASTSSMGRVAFAAAASGVTRCFLGPMCTMSSCRIGSASIGLKIMQSQQALGEEAPLVNEEWSVEEAQRLIGSSTDSSKPIVKKNTPEEDRTRRLAAILSVGDRLTPSTAEELTMIRREGEKRNHLLLLRKKSRLNSSSPNKKASRVGSLYTDEKYIAELMWRGLSHWEFMPWVRAGVWLKCLGYGLRNLVGDYPNIGHESADTHLDEDIYLRRHRLFYWKCAEGEYRRVLKNIRKPRDCQSATETKTLGSVDWGIDQLRQIRLDLRRTKIHGVVLLNHPVAQAIMERCLFIWSQGHPSVGYVQGLNDLLGILATVFIGAIDPHVRCGNAMSLGTLDVAVLNAVEADLFWAFHIIMDALKENFEPGLSGVLRMANDVQCIVKKIDPELWEAMDYAGVEIIQFGVRWIVNLLARELPLRCSLRLWDTYLAEGVYRIQHFHTYVCAILLIHFRDQVLGEKDFQRIILFLQDLPTESWTQDQIDVLIAEAFVCYETYHGARSHWNPNDNQRGYDEIADCIIQGRDSTPLQESLPRSEIRRKCEQQVDGRNAKNL